jgi:SP family xylose:H+ symportor-like MFS transporter
VDHFGRKLLQIIGALVMAVSMITLGADFWLGGKGMVALVAMLVYTAGFAVSWGPVTWVLLSEIFPNQIRGKAMAMAVGGWPRSHAANCIKMGVPPRFWGPGILRH